jgi:hypothetical protein
LLLRKNKIKKNKNFIKKIVFYLFLNNLFNNFINYTHTPESQRITNSVFGYKKFNKKNYFYKIKFIIFIINSLI